MKTNAAGIEIIKSEETLQLTAYKCAAGKWTIGYGHTEDVKPGDKITEHQADVLLEYDLERFERAVERLAPGVNANQFSALVSFAFNVGEAALERSSLLKKIKQNAPKAAALEFDKWVYGGGKKLPGLVRRRAREAKLFLEPVQ
mgnify:CR=1 FL=1